MILKKVEPTFPLRSQAGVAKKGVGKHKILPKQMNFLLVIEQKINTKPHKCHGSIWGAEIPFAKFHWSDLLFSFIFFFLGDFHKPQTGEGFPLEMLSWSLLVTSLLHLHLAKSHQQLVVMRNLKRLKGLLRELS